MAFIILAAAPQAGAQGLPNVIEGFFPTQLVAGQSNVLHLGVPGRGDVTAVEINPSAGVTVKDIKRSTDVAARWEQYNECHINRPCENTMKTL